MPKTLVAVFAEAGGAEQARQALLERQLAREALVLPRRPDGPEETAGPFLTLAGADARRPETALPAADPTGRSNRLDGEKNPPDGDNRPSDAEVRLGPGAAVGATLGGTVGALAATYVIPGAGAPALGTAPLLSTLLGAGLGTFLGSAWEAAGGEVDASRRYDPVRLGGALVVALVSEAHLPDARRAMVAIGALEVREQPGPGAGPG